MTISGNRFISLALTMLVFIIGLILSVWLQQWQKEQQQSSRDNLLSSIAEARRIQLVQQFERLHDVLLSVALDVENQSEISQSFFTSATKVLRERMGTSVRAVEWVPLITREELDTWDKTYAIEEKGRFIWEGTITNRLPVKPRSFYLPVTYLHDRFENPAIIGFDLASEPIRSRTFEDAMRSKTISVSAPIVLKQSEESGYGFLVVLPVFGKQIVGTDVRQHIRGFVVAALEAKKWFENAVQPLAPVEINILWSDASDRHPIYLHRQSESDGAPIALDKYESKNVRSDADFYVAAGNRNWVFQLLTTPSFNENSIDSLWGWLIGGTLLSLAAALLTYQLWQRWYGVARALVVVSHEKQHYQMQFDQIVKQLPSAIWMGDKSGACEQVNEAWADLFGGNSEDMLGRKWLTLVFENDVATLLDAIQNVVPGRNSTVSLRIYDLSNNLHRGWCRVTAVADANDFVRVILMYTDVTEQLHIQEELLRSEIQFRTIVDAEPACVSIVDEEASLVMMNKAGFDLLQVPPDKRAQYLGQPIAPLIHDDFQPQFLSLLRQLDVVETVQGEFPMRSLSGNIIWVESKGMKMPMGKGLKRYLFILREISHKKNNDQLLRLMIEQSSQAMMVCDMSQTIVFYNASFSSMLGYDKKQLMEQSLSRVLVSDAESVRGFWDMHLKKAQEPSTSIYFIDVSFRDRQDNPIPVRVYMSPLMEGNDVHILCSVHDKQILETREVERLQTQHRREIALRMEAIGQLTSGIAHDFNNVLASMLGYTQLAQQRCLKEDDQRLQKYLSEIEKGGHRARDMIAKLMAFSRVQDHAHVDVIDIGRTVDDVISLVRPTLPAGVSIRVLAQVAMALQAEMDSGELQQILMNLLVNARDACGENGCIDVSLSCQHVTSMMCDSCHAECEPGQYAVISIKDSGKGIDYAVRERIFDPFFTTKEFGKGTGMGLSVVHGLTHKFGGHIALQSVPGEGCQFTLYFPLSGVIEQTDVVIDSRLNMAVENEQFAPENLPQSGSKIGVVRKPRILLVDDEKAITDLLSDWLSGCGFDVISFNDSRLALGRFLTGQVICDVVILDYSMPILNGLQLASELHAFLPELPLLLCTGNEGVVDQEAAQLAGVKFILRKPVNLPEWLTILKELIPDAL